MIIVPFRPEHLSMIHVQEAQKDEFEYMADSMNPAAIAAAGEAMTAIDGDEILFIIGRVKQWARRYVVWLLLSDIARARMVKVVRSIRRIIDLKVGDGRHELVVRQGFDAGCKLAKLIEFKLHHYEEKFMPDGSDAFVYVRHI